MRIFSDDHSNGHRLSQVAGEIGVDALQDGHLLHEQLDRQDRQQRRHVFEVRQGQHEVVFLHGLSS
jgi:hypothetical protein